MQLRSLVDAQTQIFSSASYRKKSGDNRAAAENIISQISALNPSGRFLIEDTNPSPIAISLSAMVQMGGGESTIHPSIMRKVWVVADHEKAVAKVMH